MTYSREVAKRHTQMEARLTDRVDEQTRRLVRAWAVMWDQVAAEAEAAAADLVLGATGGRVTRAQALRSERVARALLAIGQAVDDLGKQAGVIITADLAHLVHDAARGQLDLIDTQLPPGIGVDFSRVSPGAMDAIVSRSTQRITSLTRALSIDGQRAIRRELLRSVPLGINPRVSASRMVRGIEDRFEGGLTRALVISRTESIDAHRNAARAADKATADLLQGWQWVCELGPRACMACVSMHGRTFDAATPGPHGHPQCRCARIPVTKSWADLGFEGIDEPPSLLPDADRFVDRLSDAQLDAMLGKRGAAAYRAGDFPREQWAKHQENPGWRPSWVPAQPPRSSSYSSAA